MRKPKKLGQLALGELCDDVDGNPRASLLEACVIVEHPEYGPYCTPHRKIMSCSVHCAARWRECGDACVR